MPGASERGRETNPVFFTAPKCLLTRLQLFSRRQTQRRLTSHNKTQLFCQLHIPPQLPLFPKMLDPSHCSQRHYTEILHSFYLHSKIYATDIDFFCFMVGVKDFKDRARERVVIFYWCLTMAITAAPAPARAQMNRWKVMSSCSKNKSQGITLPENKLRNIHSSINHVIMNTVNIMHEL